MNIWTVVLKTKIHFSFQDPDLNRRSVMSVAQRVRERGRSSVGLNFAALP